MATAAFASKELSLWDGTDVNVRALPIGKLRRFMSAWEKMGKIESDDEGLDVFVDCCGVALEHNFTEKFATLKATVEGQENGEVLSPEYKTYLLDVLDLDTIYVVLDIAGGIKADPKAMEEAVKALAAAQASQ